MPTHPSIKENQTQKFSMYTQLTVCLFKNTKLFPIRSTYHDSAKGKIKLEQKDGRMTTRVLDLFCPIGKGQRALIVAPPRAGKTTILHDIAKGVEENHPECHPHGYADR